MTATPPAAATLEGLDEATRLLVRLAAALAIGDPALVRHRAVAAAGQVPQVWVEELMLQSVLMIGYPRALIGLQAWREVIGTQAASHEDGTDFGRAPLWRERGEQVCRTVYGDNYAQLRANVRSLHPAVDAWMVVEGYGRTLGRPGLDLARRELCVVSQVAILGAERQLHSHLRGALNAGVLRPVLETVLDLALDDADDEAGRMARGLWGRIAG